MKEEKLHGILLFPILFVCVIAFLGTPEENPENLLDIQSQIKYLVDKGREVRFKSTHLIEIIDRSVTTYNRIANQISIELLHEYDLPHTVIVDYNAGILTQQFKEGLRN